MSKLVSNYAHKTFDNSWILITDCVLDPGSHVDRSLNPRGANLLIYGNTSWHPNGEKSIKIKNVLMLAVGIAVLLATAIVVNHNRALETVAEETVEQPAT